MQNAAMCLLSLLVILCHYFCILYSSHDMCLCSVHDTKDYPEKGGVHKSVIA